MVRLDASSAGDAGSIPAQGTKIPRAMQYGQKNYILKKCDRTMYEKKMNLLKVLKEKTDGDVHCVYRFKKMWL